MSGIGPIIGASMISLALQPFVQRAAQQVLDDCSFVLHIKDNINNLEGKFRVIKSRLENKEGKIVEDWLRDLVDIGYEIRDVLDEYCTVGERMASRSVSSPALSFCFGSSSATVKLPFLFRFRIAKDIKSVNKRLDQIIKQREFTKLLESEGGCGAAASTTSDPRQESTPFWDMQKKNNFVGRENENKEIIKKLLDDSTNNVGVVPIWGMGGIGKTTLARSIYHDVEVNKKYPSQNKIWLSVGNKKFSGKDIMSKILGEYGEYDANELVNKLVNKFKGEKFLIFLDDVRDLQRDEWAFLWNPLTYVGNGGFIVITAREKEVFTGNGIPVLEEEGIKPLSDNDCWLIFESRAFVNGNSDVRPKLKEVGQDIVKRLKGLPLAAEVVGCSLLDESNVNAWKGFLRVYDNEGTIKNTLRWSYNRLKSHLKQCFAYCSLFPKDHEFDENVLIKMWMAHDFIPMGGESGTPEEIGGLYFKKLVNASLFQSVDGKYIMHDMIHDLALDVSDEEFNMVNGSPNIGTMKKARHVSIVSNLNDHDNYLENLQLCKSKRILTIYSIDYFPGYPHHYGVFDKDIFRDIFKQLKSIRVLVLVTSDIKDIPDCICNLIHLRYLDLAETNIKSLPDCLCKLHNLQTVAIPLDAVLPKNIVNMANLRYLQANLTIYNGFGKLTSLQELSSISISKDMKIRELREMPKQLRGKLVIRGLENVTNLQDDGQVILKDKVHINQLELVREDETKFMTEEVLNVLSCPPNLTDLIIDGYNGLNFPKWMMEGGFFAELRTLRLSNWTDLKLREHDGYNGPLTSEGWMEWVVNASVEKITVPVPIMRPSNVMRSLSKLTITSCDGLAVLKVDALVSLKYLWIYHCSNLRTISFGATVEEVQVFLCNKLNRMESESTSSLKTLCIQCCEELRSLGNMDLQKIDSLKHLTVLGCPELMIEDASTSSSPSTSLSTLHTDNVVLFTKVFEYNNHVSLERMSIINFGFEHFSESVVNKLTLLQHLDIRNCENLISLSREFHNLTSLKKLEIRVCPKLQLLPTDGLPLSLKSLEVYHCPKLQEQCRKDSEHWHKFMHIPDIKVISENTWIFPQSLTLERGDSLTIGL